MLHDIHIASEREPHTTEAFFSSPFNVRNERDKEKERERRRRRRKRKRKRRTALL
jgi:hypothetical protein